MRLLLCCAALLLLSSCFEIVEDIRFQPNYSGSYKGIVNLSASKTQIVAYMKLDSVFGTHVPKQNEVEIEIARKETLLKHCKGIKNASIARDFNNFIFTIKFDFDNLDSFNNAYTIVTSDKHSTVNVFPFSAGNKSFSRQDKLQKIASDATKNKNKYPRLFEQSKYTAILHFPFEISTCTNSSCKLSNDKKNIFISSSLANLVNHPSFLNTQILFK